MHHVPARNDLELEEWFLAVLSDNNPPFDSLLETLASLRTSGKLELAQCLSDLLLDSLKQKGNKEGAILLLEITYGPRADDAARRACLEQLPDFLPSGKFGEMLLQAAGFDGLCRLEECFRKLKLLTSLRPGMPCTEKTWGIGVIKQVDDFYGRVVIDFEGKKAHEMSLSYAAESLRLPDGNHILVKHRDNPSLLEELVRTNPAEVVRLALRSFGPLSVDSLQTTLADRLIPAAEWETFWTSARKALKQDPLVSLPSRRNDPIKLLDKEYAFDAKWFETLNSERDVEKIVEMAECLVAAGWRMDGDLPARVLSDKLAFVAANAGSQRLGLVARAALLADNFNLMSPSLAAMLLPEAIVKSNGLLTVSRDLPVKQFAAFIRLLASADEPGTVSTLIELLPSLQSRCLGPVMEFLRQTGAAEQAARAFRASMDSGNASIEMVLWFASKPGLLFGSSVDDKRPSQSLFKPSDLPRYALEVLERTPATEHKKVRSALLDLVENETWLKKALEDSDDAARWSLFERVRSSAGLPETEKRSLMARLIAIYPQLQQRLARAEGGEMETPPLPRGGLTSWRSYLARQKRLRNVIEKQVPDCAREIAQARSYGDLRENAEYKAAKERQGLLAKMKAELESDLSTVRGSDFTGLPTDSAGMGATVVIETPDGLRRAYHILGEWDQDEELGIIPCKSRVALLLSGHRAGDTVNLPTSDGEEKCAIVEVSKLPPHISKWVKAET